MNMLSKLRSELALCVLFYACVYFYGLVVGLQIINEQVIHMVVSEYESVFLMIMASFVVSLCTLMCAYVNVTPIMYDISDYKYRLVRRWTHPFHKRERNTYMYVVVGIIVYVLLCRNTIPLIPFADKV